MEYGNLQSFVALAAGVLPPGPVGVILAEDLVEVDTTIRHHLNVGFRALVVLGPAELVLPDDLTERVHLILTDIHLENVFLDALNRIIAALPGRWLYYCYNAEYLFFPFCETRTVGEVLTYHGEERRDSMLAYVVDLYAGDLNRFPNAVSLETAMMDKSGYYALARKDAARQDQPKERQLDFYGGLRWRFEEHVPEDRRKIDRIALFRARPGLILRSDHTFNDEEYNTYSCPWHHNLTAAICSFRTAKALKSNAGSTFDIQSFNWYNSTEFQWSSQQLLDLGLMEPGQWF